MVRQRCKREKLTASRRFRGFLKLTPAKMKSCRSQDPTRISFLVGFGPKIHGTDQALGKGTDLRTSFLWNIQNATLWTQHQTAWSIRKNERPLLEIKWARVSSSISFLSTIMIVTSHYDDLTIPELFHALKQRLCGISSNCIRCVALFDPSRTHDRVTLTCVVSSNSSGLDLQEVREIDDESR